MKRKHIAILVAQTLLILTFLLYALVQRTKAIQYQELAAEAQQRAEQSELMAIEAQREAMTQARLVREAQAIAEEEIRGCEALLRNK